MKTPFLLAAVLGCPLAFAQQPAAPQQQQQPTVSAAQSIINQMSIATKALADVLQGVNDKASADAAAREVGELIVQIKLLNDLAGYAPEHAQSIEAMRMAQVNALMPMLMNTSPCYGSEAMLKALAPVVTVKPAKQVQPQPEVQPESPSQQLAEAILEGYKDLTTVLKGVTDKASADAAAPLAAQVIATILPLYDEAEGTEGMADVVGVQIAQTQEISDLADLIENLLQAETPLYGSEALSKALAEIVTVEEAQEEDEQEAESQEGEQPAEDEQPAEEEADGDDEQELAPSEILAPVPQA